MKNRTRAEWEAITAQAWQLYNHGHDDSAVVMAKRALRIAQHDMGPDHPDTATSLKGLAVLYDILGQYAQAEPLYKRALAIWEKALGPRHRKVGGTLYGLAEMYCIQKRYTEAEPIYQRSLAIAEKVLGPDDPYMSTILNSIAEMYDGQDQHAQAEPLRKRAQAIKSMWRERRNEELYAAAGKGNVLRVKSLLAAGANPAYRGEEETPLHEAIISGHPSRMQVARLLIKQQIANDGGTTTGENGRSMDCYLDANSDFGTPLGIAVDNDDIRMVKFLLNDGAHADADGCSGGTPLHRAAKSGSMRILRLLLDRMEEQRREEDLEEEGHIDVVSLLLDVDDTTPLHLAIEAGHFPAVKLLVAFGANVNAVDGEDETPLFKAACGGHGEMVAWLLAEGASVDGVKDKSPLFASAAAAVGKMEAVAMFLKAGKSLDAAGETVLSRARRRQKRAEERHF